nr:tetratricopeptide repeat protein [Sphingomonas sp. GC_Shp_1]
MVLLATVLSVAATPVAADPPVPASAGRDGVVAYLKARAAEADGEIDRAAAGYAVALAAAPGNLLVADRAYRQGMAAGDLRLAARAAGTLAAGAEAAPDLPLLGLAEAAARNDVAGVDAATAGLDKGALRVLSPSLRGWIALVRGGDPLAPLAAAGRDPIASHVTAEQRGLLLIARGDITDGSAAVLAQARGAEGYDLRAAAAQLLFGVGDAAEARSLLTGDDPVLVAMRTGKGDGAKPTLGFAVSRLFAGLGADLLEQRASSLGLGLARAALVADPGNDRARLLLGQALARDGATAAALRALSGVATSSPFYAPAVAGRIMILVNAGRDAEALDLARTRATDPGASADDWQRYADRLVAARRYAEAAPWYRRVTDQVEPGGQWAAFVQYGGALEQAGDWPGARAALRRAVVLGPSQPLALNYLGYASATRGEDMAAATAMLERAHALLPDNLAIVDSLGWVYHLAGDDGRALPMIERAAIGEPADPEIAEHLGDLYWTLGRRYEARYAWRAAALTANPDDQPRLTARIETGLPSHDR